MFNQQKGAVQMFQFLSINIKFILAMYLFATFSVKSFTAAARGAMKNSTLF